MAPTSFFADYGCHVRILEETRALQKLGHQVAICTYHTGHDLAGLDIRRAMNTPWQKTVQVGSNLHKLYYDALLALKAAQAAFQVRPSVVHAHLHEGALIGYLVSRMLRVPLVFDFQGSLTSEMLDHHFLRADSVFFRPLQRLERLINHMADRVVTSSQNAADILVREFGYPQEKVTTLADSV
ncbi:MAG: glycosyltransferase, partial [Chloroflexi bacterium]|nr:glycosyltransferase [Chloroflexota bacterium]